MSSGRKDYRGGLLYGNNIRQSNTGRSLDIGEEVVLLDGRQAVVVEVHEGNYVFDYYVQMPDGAEFRVATDELVPVNNP